MFSNIVVVISLIEAYAAAEAVSSTNLSNVEYYENLILSEEEKARNYDLPQDARQYKANGSNIVKDFGTYDYIIIGCGSAGSVIASRLSETNWTVLVLEAGTFENDFVDIPGMSLYAAFSKYNWNYMSLPQASACLGMVDKRCPYPRGRGFGGSSLINGLLYARGNRIDFDKWELQGNPGWSYKHVLPYFIKSENAKIGNPDIGYHGKGGPLNVEYSRPYSRQFYAFIDANVELGRKELDYNGKEQLGVSSVQQNTLYGTRDSASRAFLFPALHRKNMKVSANSFVTKISIDRTTKSAYGVHFLLKGTRYKVTASKEIILSSGAIASPQILMLSGIGPADHLRQLKIPVIQDLPVGKNLDDHPAFYGLNILSNYSQPIESLRQEVINYLHDIGPFTAAGNNQGLGFFQTNLTNITGLPDVEILLNPPNRSTELSQRSYSFTNESAKALWGDIENTSTFALPIILLHPVSRGMIELKCSDPFEYPIIDSRYLSDSNNKDIETLYQGVQLVLQMLNTNAMRKINATLGKVVHPDCARWEYLSKEYWYCSIRYFTMNMYHPISACKMGPNPKNGGVVDSKFRVHGIKKLRVADSSVIPFSLSGHPNAVAIMIGERASDFIRQSS